MVESRDVVSRFLAGGYSLDSASLDFFMKDPGKAEAFLAASSEAEKHSKRPAIITLEYIQDVLGSHGAEAGLCIAPLILMDFAVRESKISVEDAITKRAGEYEAARRLLSEKLSDVVSINKIQKQQKFSLIVSVLEKTGEGTALVEDATGSLNLNFGDTKEFTGVVEGDIIGVECESSDATPAAKRIVFVDVPLKRTVAVEGDALCVFINKADPYAAGFEAKSFEKFLEWAKLNSARGLYVIVFSDPGHAKDSEEILARLPSSACRSIVSAPSVFELGGLKVVSCQSESMQPRRGVWGGNDNEIMTNFLKRRALPLGPAYKCGGSAGYTTFFDVVPDIFVAIGSKEPAASNYKGTSVISIGSFSDVPVFFSIDLRTRDFNKLDLS
ncbi:MAG: hypothetical protein NT016_01215 [Candidatus Aenigmarchaeota archaeon]|nr:hypothetical protein [Candidatus Aenigmarchaeota archaeon]